MRRALAPLLLALTLAAPIAVRAQIAVEGGPPPPPLTTQQMAALNAEFDAAVQAARASLPVFWGRLAENGDGPRDAFGLKVAFKTPNGGTEDLWLSDIKRQGSRVLGRLNYDPQSVTSLHRTDIIPIREADIVDWSFKEGRKRYGEFTTRVIAKVNPGDAARSLAALSDNPLPPDARGK